MLPENQKARAATREVAARALPEGVSPHSAGRPVGLLIGKPRGSARMSGIGPKLTDDLLPARARLGPLSTGGP